jgi:hypothetical protein
MPPTRDHNPVLIEEFNGLWKRGDDESTPIDHFSDCNNIKFIQSGFQTRDGLDFYPKIFISNVARLYTFTHELLESLVVLDTAGNFYDTSSPTPYVPILTVPGATDFAFQAFNGRGYISPSNGKTGLQNEFVYVYDGKGNPARKAGGKGPIPITGGMTATISAASGNIEPGVHIFGVIYETDTGFQTKIGGKVMLNVTTDNKKVTLSNIPISPDAFVKQRHIVATRAIDPALYTGDLDGYQFFFVPGGEINDNTTTTLDVNFYDADLLADAWFLLDIMESIPASVGLGTYHERLLAWTQFGQPDPDPVKDTLANLSRCLVSEPGDPETISEVDGLILAPMDGLNLTNAQEYRDVLYLFKRTKTLSYTDNGDVPTSWPLVTIDEGLGCTVHGVATVIDSGGINIEFIILINASGCFVFNGTFNRPEMSWKIKDFWFSLANTPFNNQDFDKLNVMQIYNDTTKQEVYISLPDGTMLMCDYQMGGDYMQVRWTKWSFAINVTTISLVETNKLIMGSNGPHA